MTTWHGCMTAILRSTVYASEVRMCCARDGKDDTTWEGKVGKTTTRIKRHGELWREHKAVWARQGRRGAGATGWWCSRGGWRRTRSECHGEANEGRMTMKLGGGWWRGWGDMIDSDGEIGVVHTGMIVRSGKERSGRRGWQGADDSEVREAQMSAIRMTMRLEWCGCDGVAGCAGWRCY
jgi:hypothetical protein